ncbi:hypothetical protein ACFE04_002777 [Oxalis oulophora]
MHMYFDEIIYENENKGVGEQSFQQNFNDGVNKTEESSSVVNRSGSENTSDSEHDGGDATDTSEHVVPSDDYHETITSLNSNSQDDLVMTEVMQLIQVSM